MLVLCRLGHLNMLRIRMGRRRRRRADMKTLVKLEIIPRVNPCPCLNSGSPSSRRRLSTIGLLLRILRNVCNLYSRTRRRVLKLLTLTIWCMSIMFSAVDGRVCRLVVTCGSRCLNTIFCRRLGRR